MSVSPLVTVVIPVFNGADCIENAIGSVLSQTECEVEVVVVDDGSTDETGEILKKYGDKGLITYYQQKNKGPSAARNLAIKSAKGEYICFLDADDILKGNSIRDRLAVYAKYPGIGLLATDFNQKTLGGSKHKIHSEQISRRKFLDDASGYVKLVDGNIHLFDKRIFFDPIVIMRLVWTGTVMVPKAVFEVAGMFNESLRITQDIDLWLRIAEKYEIAFLDVSTATYILHDKGVTNQVPIYYLENIKVLEQYLHPAGRTPLEYRQKIKEKIAAYYFSVAYFHYNHTNYDLARRYFRKSLIYDKKRFICYQFVIITSLPGAIVDILRNVRRYLSGSTTTSVTR